MTKSIRSSGAALAAATALLAACGTLPDQGGGSGKPVTVNPPHTVDGITYLDQNWSGAQRQWYYTTSQGSRLMPYDWFMALIDPASGRPVSEMLTSLHYLPGTKDASNPDGLAVGFVKDVDKVGGPAIGLTCAACHTNDVKVDGTTLRVDGAGVTGDLYGLLKMIENGLGRLLTDDAYFEPFAEKVLPKGYTPADKLALYESVARFLNGTPERKGYSAFVSASTTKVPWGNARTDAFGMIFNRVSAIDLNYPSNNRPPAAPVSYPHLWAAPQQPKNQWDGLVSNANALEALGRNAGEVLGVFGEAALKRPTPAYYAYHSSVRAGALMDMEEQLRHLATPVWPSSILGSVDTVKAARGAALYQQSCVSCHAIRPRTDDPNAPTPIVMTPLFDYKIDQGRAFLSICSKGVDASVKAGAISVTYASDPKMAVDAACRTVSAQQLTGVKMPPIIGTALTAEGPAALMLANAVLGTLIGKLVYEDPALIIKLLEQMAGEKLDDDVRAALTDPKTLSGSRKDAAAGRARALLAKVAFKVVSGKASKSSDAGALTALLAYKARPLDGIWATAPFMHNGSVPSLYEMLLPADKRSKTFPVGSGAFDPKTVGLPTVGPATGYWFDTGLEGNANTGHEWGAGLSDEDRWALVEYLKTL